MTLNQRKMWKTKNNRVIVEVDGLVEKSVKVGKYEMQLDTAFRRLWNANQKCKVVAAPDGSDLDPGDTVYVHHFVIEDERRVPVAGKEYRWLEYNQIYCKVKDGIVKALGYYVLVEPVKFDESKFKKETASGLLLTRKAGTQNVDRVGVVAHIGQVAEEAGLKVGDKIFFNKNCEYEINIEGKKLYRMELRDVITVIDPDIEFTV
jgi:co-chaperonin GroES (HSP10)